RQAAALEIDTIWVDALNPRPLVWPAVAALLKAEFPQLLPRYRGILFDPSYRRDYLAELHALVNHAARQAGIADRVNACL
ncbi:MAG: hypothetical protein JW818_14415, partial [Pirellulales bacterium]|nr:hypothetical protein [Pirellulales bacterium]